MPFDNGSDTSHGTRRQFLALVGGTTLAVAGRKASAAGEFTKRHVAVDSFDGTEIAATLYEPPDDNPHPAMLMTHGYGLNRTTSPLVRTRAEMYARNGYVTLAYDSRGFGGSGGQVNVNGPKEVKDAQTLITWLADRDNVLTDGPNDPRIGMDGTSYGGGIQLNTAAAEGRGDGVTESDDRLDALVPRWAWNDLTYSLAPNGVIKHTWALLLTLAGAQGSHLMGNDPMDFVRGQSPKLYETLFEGLLENELSRDSKAYFDARSPGQDIEDITAPALFIHGWPDTLFTPNETVWNADGLTDTPHRLLFTDGGHSLEAVSLRTLEHEVFANRKALAWIDTHLRGDGRSDLPPVTYYEMESGKWRAADGIPPSSATPRTLSLADVTEDETSWVTNSVVPNSTSQLFPVNGDSPGSSVAFDFPITQPSEVVGSPTLGLSVDPAGPETRLFAKLYHVSDGTARLIDNQVTPLLIEGDGPKETDVDMVAFQRRFEAGDALRLTVSTTDAAFQPSRTSIGAMIHHSDRHPSTLDVPVVRNGNSGH